MPMVGAPKQTATGPDSATMTRDYRDQFWTIDHKGIVELWGPVMGAPARGGNLGVSLTAAVSASSAPDDGVVTIKFQDGTKWLVGYDSRKYTPGDEWMGEMVRAGQIARKRALQRGHVPHDECRRVLFTGVAPEDRPVTKLERLLGATVIPTPGNPQWSEAAGADGDVRENRKLLREIAENYDVLAGEIPLVVIEALRDELTSFDDLTGPSGKKLRVYSVVRRCDGRRRWARVW